MLFLLGSVPVGKGGSLGPVFCVFDVFVWWVLEHLFGWGLGSVFLLSGVGFGFGVAADSSLGLTLIMDIFLFEVPAASGRGNIPSRGLVFCHCLFPSPSSPVAEVVDDSPFSSSTSQFSPFREFVDVPVILSWKSFHLEGARCVELYSVVHSQDSFLGSSGREISILILTSR